VLVTTLLAEYRKVNSEGDHPMAARGEALQNVGTDARLDRDTSNCSIARTLEVVGEKRTILIL
jgi:hypothetical protein